MNLPTHCPLCTHKLRYREGQIDCDSFFTTDVIHSFQIYNINMNNAFNLMVSLPDNQNKTNLIYAAGYSSRDKVFFVSHNNNASWIEVEPFEPCQALEKIAIYLKLAAFL